MYSVNFPYRRLVEKLENMRNNAIGDGRETCLLCNSKFAALKVIAKRCDICGKVHKSVFCFTFKLQTV